MNKVQDIIEKIKVLEKALLLETQKKEAEFFYTIKKNKVYFDKKTKKQHKQLTTTIITYLLESSPWSIITVPVMWFCIVPAVFMDLVITLYQLICFTAHGIPKVKRENYIVIDHHSLGYLNIIEKFNCIYCSYFNGLIAYIQEIAARTEQHWCPIKHARKLGSIHSRYHKYLEYGDHEEFKKCFVEISNDYDDLIDDNTRKPD
ncbi:MAG: hypothetical protein OQK32_05125 [Gammaproteobacteria bacterium]|nr:hypothetical protein [Gammaproteobacteria bacterium]MCW8923632.1 hypothetical protein [Gammaproteobacteria bacterium]